MVHQFGEDPLTRVRDLRAQPHSGYRAVHVWLNLPGLGKAEIQVRTHLQGQWANMYEAAADVVGRNIRYGGYPEHAGTANAVRDLQNRSISGLKIIEESRNGVVRLLSSVEGDPHLPEDYREEVLRDMRANLKAIIDADKGAMVALAEQEAIFRAGPIPKENLE
jgi:hypothetical protein